METRRLIVAFLAAMAAFYVWTVIASYIWPRRQPTTQPVAQVETRPADVQTRPGDTYEATQPATAQVVGGAARPVEGDNIEPVTLGSAPEGRFPMELTIQPRGASVADVKLRGHYASVAKKEPYHIIEPATTPDGDRIYAFTTPKIRFEELKLDVALDEAIWRLEQPEAGRVVATLPIESAQGEPLARIVKEFNLPSQAPGSPRYDLELTLKVENLTGQPMRIILVQQGPVGFRREDLRMEDRAVVGAIWNGQSVTAKLHARTEVAKKGEVRLGSDQGDTRIAWGAEANRYFTCIVRPAERIGASDPPRFAELEAVDVAESQNPSELTELTALTFQFVTTPRLIAPGGVETVAFDAYIGPKSKKGFESVPEYAQQDYYAVVRQSFYICAPASLTSVMMGLLDWLHRLPPYNYGIAIIILVLVVRGLLHPITKKSQVNMVKMQKQMSSLQPKIEAVKKKYANDRAQLQQEMMKVYQEAGINPAGNLLTCLPLLLQIPIWGALWAALSSTIEMRHAGLDPWWIRDLTSPDALISFDRAINIPLISYYLTGPIMGFNLLPILLGISQVLQTKYMPRGTPAAQTGGAPDQLEQQRKMMMFMSGFFVLFLYNAPSGLNLYIMASNFFGILEQWRIRKHIAEEEKRIAEGREPPRPAWLARLFPQKPGAPRETWLQRKWKDLAKQAEEARRVQSQRDKKPRSSR